METVFRNNDENDCSIAAIILAAGFSRRMNGVKKEYHILPNGVTVLESAVRAFISVPSINRIVIAVSDGTEDAARKIFGNINKPEIIFVNGGEKRSHSVFNALSALPPYNPHYVLIHDGARPWVSPSLIENIITAVKKHGAVIPLLPLTETPKEIDNTEHDAVFIKRHLKRVNVGAAQTPQAFRFPDILNAYKKAISVKEDFTDDAEIWGKFCGNVAVISGDPANKKITFREDLI